MHVHRVLHRYVSERTEDYTGTNKRTSAGILEASVAVLLVLLTDSTDVQYWRFMCAVKTFYKLWFGAAIA